MKKILVPIDFSVASSWGYFYALELAASIGAELVILHMYLPDSDTNFAMEDLRESTQIKKLALLNHLKSATQAPVDSDLPEVKKSYIVDYGEKSEIAHYAEIHNVDLIIMGTQGAGQSSSKKIFGSNTSSVVKKSSFPVLVVPSGAQFQHPVKIAYATDLSSPDLELIKQIGTLAKAINSKLYCVYVNLLEKNVDTNKAKDFQALLDKSIADLPVSFTTISALKIEEGLDIFCRINQIGILSLLKRNRNLWERLTGSKSTTNFMALHSEIPLLIFHEESK